MSDCVTTSKTGVRYWYIRNVGPVPPGFNVCHHCDNPMCKNKDHIFLGTQSDNMKDMVSKGRHPTHDIRTCAAISEGGKNNTNGRKLTIKQVSEIKLSSERTKILAERFKVTWCTIHRIKKGKTFKNE